ncbi:hypothetical protein BpHYR1_019038, partial [Brachionus plicatilis]
MTNLLQPADVCWFSQIKRAYHEADEMDGFDNDVDESPVASNDKPTVEMIDEHSVTRALDFVQPQMSSLSLANSKRVISPESVNTPSPLFIDKPQSSSQVNLAPISQTPNISQCILSTQIPLDIMMVRNDPPIYSQNHNIPFFVGTHQGHTVQRLQLQDIPIQQNIQNTSTSV